MSMMNDYRLGKNNSGQVMDSEKLPTYLKTNYNMADQNKNKNNKVFLEESKTKDDESGRRVASATLNFNSSPRIQEQNQINSGRSEQQGQNIPQSNLDEHTNSSSDMVAQDDP